MSLRKIRRSRKILSRCKICCFSGLCNIANIAMFMINRQQINTDVRASIKFTQCYDDLPSISLPFAPRECKLKDVSTSIMKERMSDRKRRKISLRVYYLPIDYAIFLVEITKFRDYWRIIRCKNRMTYETVHSNPRRVSRRLIISEDWSFI